jgi:hypothetical protein
MICVSVLQYPHDKNLTSGTDAPVRSLPPQVAAALCRRTASVPPLQVEILEQAARAQGGPW